MKVPWKYVLKIGNDKVTRKTWFLQDVTLWAVRGESVSFGGGRGNALKFDFTDEGKNECERMQLIVKTRMGLDLCIDKLVGEDGWSFHRK